MLLKCLQHESAVERLAERIEVYAYLRTTEDQADDNSQESDDEISECCSSAF